MIMFAVVFGLSMDYEVLLVSRVREQWIRKGEASAAVGDGIALTGRAISAAAAVMVCVFLSFTLGDERTLKEFGSHWSSRCSSTRSSFAACCRRRSSSYLARRHGDCRAGSAACFRRSTSRFQPPATSPKRKQIPPQAPEPELVPTNI